MVFCKLDDEIGTVVENAGGRVGSVDSLEGRLGKGWRDVSGVLPQSLASQLPQVPHRT
jgi:hypothetical protein